MRHIVNSPTKTLCGLPIVKSTDLTVSAFRCTCIECLEIEEKMEAIDFETDVQLGQLQRQRRITVLKRTVN